MKYVPLALIIRAVFLLLLAVHVALPYGPPAQLALLATEVNEPEDSPQVEPSPAAEATSEASDVNVIAAEAVLRKQELLLRILERRIGQLMKLQEKLQRASTPPWMPETRRKDDGEAVTEMVRAVFSPPNSSSFPAAPGTNCRIVCGPDGDCKTICPDGPNCWRLCNSKGNCATVCATDRGAWRVCYQNGKCQIISPLGERRYRVCNPDGTCRVIDGNRAPTRRQVASPQQPAGPRQPNVVYRQPGTRCNRRVVCQPRRRVYRYP